MRRCVLPAVVAGMALVAWGTATQAAVITIPNGNFLSPDQSKNPYFADVQIDSWSKESMPTWWTYGDAYWQQTAGVFYNATGLVPDTYITNLTSSQGAFLFTTPQAGLYQTLTATYQAGQSYHLNFGLIPSDGSNAYVPSMQLGTQIDIVLYYLDGTDRKPVKDIVIANSQELLNNHTLMKNFTLDTADVKITDPWAGKPIGIEFLSLADSTQTGSQWDIGNVQLTSTPVPEAGTLGLLATGAVLLVGRRRK
jgi:hypothetical protein